ncbi:MAG: hypothetical protein HYV29_07695 [Ignavibacteriales bacterium]|nr:hypothetical protein [Ignavibacteriales bacterium]
MAILGGVILCYMLSIVIGRNTKRMKVSTIALLAFLAAVQVAIVLHQLYTLEFPID